MTTTGVITTIAVVVGSTESKNLIERKTLTMRPVLAGFILGFFLFPLDSAEPELSKQLQVLLIVGSLLVNGQDLINLSSKIISSGKA